MSTPYILQLIMIGDGKGKMGATATIRNHKKSMLKPNNARVNDVPST